MQTDVVPIIFHRPRSHRCPHQTASPRQRQQRINQFWCTGIWLKILNVGYHHKRFIENDEILMNSIVAIPLYSERNHECLVMLHDLLLCRLLYVYVYVFRADTI